jgi:hypothetical protein
MNILAWRRAGERVTGQITIRHRQAVEVDTTIDVIFSLYDNLSFGDSATAT